MGDKIAPDNIKNNPRQPPKTSPLRHLPPAHRNNWGARGTPTAQPKFDLLRI